MRLDKFLKVSRIIKRRTVANDACGKERVTVNSKTVKPAYDVKPGDIIEVTFGERVFRCKVLSTPEHIAKDAVGTMYEVL